ncbi:uncharacterized protein LOC125013725 [Mugil cephalus]|uniref:uncharacterized protein LOC125013725 n=1 Tax=Mugil cephalus TaxID=48193 RepID=UPI001FB725A5|nr:uncharacterized protein LOC125013725 [Mugil cephalus]
MKWRNSLHTQVQEVANPRPGDQHCLRLDSEEATVAVATAAAGKGGEQQGPYTSQVKYKDCPSHKPGWKISIMFSSCAPCSRLRVFVLICAAVMTFITYSDGARASSTAAKGQNGAGGSVLRRAYAPHSRHRPSSVATLSTETGTNSETKTSGSVRETPSVTDYPSNPLLFAQGSFSFSQRGLDNREYQGRVTKERRGHGVGGERPTSSVFTGRPQQEGAWQPRHNNQQVAPTGNYYSSNSGIIRKSSPREGGSPLHQSFSQIWDHEYAKNEVPQVVYPVVAEGESTVRKSFHSSLFPSQNGALWSRPAQRGHYSAREETNVLPAVGPWSTSSGIQSSKYPSFSSRPAPREASISGGSEASAIKRNPRPEKLRSSITESSGETLGHKRVQSYLFKDSRTSVNTVTGDGREASRGQSNVAATPHKQIAAGVYSRLESGRKNNDVLYHDARVPQHVSRTETEYKPTLSLIPPRHTTAQPPTRLPLLPVTVKSNDGQRFVHTPHFRDTSSSEKSAPGGRVDTTTRRFVQDSKQGQSAKSIYGLRGFKKPLRKAAKEPSGSKESPLRHSFDKGKDYAFKITNRFPSLSAKYSFGQRGAPPTTAAPPDLQRTPEVHPSPSPGIQIATVSTPRPLTSGLKLPEHDAGMNASLNHKPYRVYKRIYGLKGFNVRPLEGAKTSEPDVSAALHQGLKLSRAQAWQPRGIPTPSDRAGETKPDSDSLSGVSESEASSEDLKPPLKAAGRSPSLRTFTPEYPLYGFLPVNNQTTHAHSKKQWKYSQRRPGVLSSAQLKSTASPKAETTPEPRTTRKFAAMKATLLRSSTSRTVRGKRVKAKHAGSKNLNGSAGYDTGNSAIVRLPQRPAGVKAVTYSDIVGSASFSSVRAENQAPVTSTDEVYFPNRTATDKVNGSLGNWTLNPDDGAQGVKNTSKNVGGVKEDEQRTSEEAGDELETSGLFLDNEGSGDFNDASSSVTGGRDGGEDLSELEYLRISAGNVSFKSVRRSHPDETTDTS